MREQRADGSVITGAYTLDGLPRWDSVAGDRIYLGRQLVAQRGNGGYMHTDALGSPVARTGSALELLGRTRYEPYGATAAGAAPLRIGFAGHVSDADTALLYMQQRYYEPIAGRFLSVDPVTTDAKTGEHFNRYVYAENNPYKYADPDGQLPILLVPLALKALDAAMTAADLYTAAQTGGAGAVGRVALESLAGNALPGGKILGRLVHGVGDAAKGAAETTTVIGRVKDLQKLGPGEKSLLDRLPNLGNPKATWQQNAGVLREEMRLGKSIRDASPLDVDGPFLNAERNLLLDRGWTFDRSTTFWMPPKP